MGEGEGQATVTELVEAVAPHRGLMEETRAIWGGWASTTRRKIPRLLLKPRATPTPIPLPSPTILRPTPSLLTTSLLLVECPPPLPRTDSTLPTRTARGLQATRPTSSPGSRLPVRLVDHLNHSRPTMPRLLLPLHPASEMVSLYLEPILQTAAILC